MSRGVPARRIALMLESDGPGGAERLLLQMAEELRERGHDVCPVGPIDGSGWLAEEFRQRGFVPETFSNTTMFDWKCVQGLSEVFRRRRIDLVHSHEFGMAVYGAAACLASRIPHVITMHGGKYYATKTRRRLALRWALRRSRATAAVSRATARHLEQSLRIRTGEINVVYNGIRFTPGARPNVRRELALADDELLIVAIGNLYPVKGHRVLIEALAELARRDSAARWRLAIAGRGEEEEALRRSADEGGIRDRVHFLGFRVDVPDILAAADIYAMPSLSEGHPLALLEAMFAGVPIVASNVGGIPEVVSDAEHALLVPSQSARPLADAVNALLLDPELRRRLAAVARQRADSLFSVGAMIDSYEALYGEG